MSVQDIELRTDDQYNIVVLGEASVGKTTLTIRAKERKFIKSYDPTLYDVHKFKLIVDKVEEQIEIQDTAGQEIFQNSVIDEFIRKANGFVFMYEIQNKDSLVNLEEKYISKVRTIKQNKFFAVLVGNKSDQNEFREVDFQQGKKIADKYNIPFYEISLMNQADVSEIIFQDLVRMMKSPRLNNQNLQQSQHKKHWCENYCNIY